MERGRKVILTISSIILLLLWGGQVIPRLIISPIPVNLTADSREFVQAAMIAARDLTSNPAESAMQTGFQVRSLKKTSDATGCNMMRASTYHGRYTTVIHAYTWFGIPYAEINADCDGATIRRSLWLFFTR